MKQIIFTRYKKYIYIIPFLLIGLLTGCNSDSTSTAPSTGNFSMSVKKATDPPASDSLSDTLSLDTVKIMMKNVELFSDSSDRSEEHEDSEEVKSGPFVIDLNLNGSVNTVVLTEVPAGTYNGVKFEIHRLRRYEVYPDSEFIDSTCGERGYSIIATGTYLGNHFVFKSNQAFRQRVRFANPITVTSDGLINVTLTVDPYSWFMKDGNIIDPTDHQNYWLINRLIKNSFGNCFRDDDRNGRRDD